MAGSISILDLMRSLPTLCSCTCCLQELAERPDLHIKKCPNFSATDLKERMGVKFDAVFQPRNVWTWVALSHAIKGQFASEDVLGLKVRSVDDFGPLLVRST